ncbi:MAG: DUF58 domain-containing protein [Mobilitalea sp.]
MKLNRIICVIAILGSGVFVSYFGGTISYSLFYLSLLTPVLSFLYTLFVYFQFKLAQSISTVLVRKGEWNDYSFTIANENFITFSRIKVNFFKEKSTMEISSKINEYSLLPGESEKLYTRMKCNYRGEYEVGIDSVEVTDYLYLFTIKYPLPSRLKVYVLPRVVPIDRLGIALTQEDVKNPTRYSNTAEEELDTEIRKYSPGDSRKRIHWKASARMKELISRKYQEIPKSEIAIFMDLTRIKEDELKVVIFEDKIIESVLAIANYYAVRNTPAHIIYDKLERTNYTISSKETFNVFYKTCAKINFEGKLPVEALIEERQRKGERGMFYIVATHTLSKELYMTALKAIALQNSISILFISDDVTDTTKDFINGMRLSGIKIYQIMSDNDIEDVLSKEIA